MPCSNVQIEAFAATYNVVTLKPFGQSDAVAPECIFDGTAKFLAEQMMGGKFHCLSLQETRSNVSGLFENHRLIGVVAAGTESSNYGCEIWLNKSLPIGMRGNTKLRQKLFVLHASPRLLVVKCKFPPFDLIVVFSCHEPHSGAALEARRKATVVEPSDKPIDATALQ